MSPKPKHQIGNVSVWLGNYESEEDFHAYLAEIVDVEGNSTTRFSSDAGIQVHPHFCEGSFSESEKDIADLVNDISFAPSFQDELFKRCRELDITSAKCGVFVFELEYPLEREFPNKNLRFVGSFPFSHDFSE